MEQPGVVYEDPSIEETHLGSKALAIVIPQDLWEKVTVVWKRRGIRVLKPEFLKFLYTKFKTEKSQDNSDEPEYKRFWERLRTGGFPGYYVKVTHNYNKPGGTIYSALQSDSRVRLTEGLTKVYQQFLAYEEEIKKLKQKQEADIATGLAPVIPTGVSNLIGKYGATGKARRRKTRKGKKTRRRK
jgi:hypothetical protein